VSQPSGHAHLMNVRLLLALPTGTGTRGQRRMVVVHLQRTRGAMSVMVSAAVWGGEGWRQLGLETRAPVAAVCLCV
jgi:hypothetical protein